MRRPKTDKVPWHAMAEGTRRLALFHELPDYRYFLALFHETSLETNCDLGMVSLMTNHYHGLIYASSDELTGFMRRVNHRYSIYHNKKYGLRGHAFGGPYKRYIQWSGLYLPRTAIYIAMNPVAAGIVPRPEEYPWSSVRTYLNLPGDPIPVNPRPVLEVLSEFPIQARQMFRDRLEAARATPQAIDRGVPSAGQIQQQHFAWLREAAREKRDQLQGQHPTEVALVWGRQCGVPARAMAAALGDRSKEDVYAIVQRMQRRISKDSELARKLALP